MCCSVRVPLTIDAIDYFTHNIDLISQARKNFRPQNSNDDTAITEQSDSFGTPNGLIMHS